MTRARHALLLAFAFAASVTLGGCDLLSSDDDRAPDAELILGAWTGTSINVRADTNSPLGTISLPFPGADASAATAEFSASSATLGFDPDDDAEFNIKQLNFSIPLPNEVSVSGTYRLDTDAAQLVLSRPEIEGGELRLGYALRSETSLEIIAEDAAAFASLFGFIGGDAEALAGIVSGGSIRYTK